jgi:sec-independent protein translocase protein TatC
MANIHHHFFEIKLRFFYLIISILCTFFMFYNHQIEIVYIIGKPFIELQQTFIFLELTEAFYTLLKISGIFTLVLLIPFFFYHFWSFFIPSFYNFQRKKINFFVVLFLCLFFCEILFTYFVLLPKICNFLLSFEIASELENSGFHIDPLISVEFTARFESYVKLLVKFFTIIFLLFQIPLCVCLLYSKKILHVYSFYHNRKILSLISLLLSAFLVPPDVLSQLIVALIFSIVFEFLIFIGLFFE